MLTCTLQAHYIAHETTPYCPTIPNHRLNGTVYVRQAGVTPRAATCNFVARKVTPQHRSHIPYLCAAQRPPAISICGTANGCIPSEVFYYHTTKRLVVIAFKLCQEGNKQPLIQQPFSQTGF